MNKRKELTGIDLFKLIAAFGVVAVHTELPFFKILGRLGVPFFVIISSYFFFQHYEKNEDRPGYYLIRFEKRIFYLFLSWELFYTPVMLRNTYLLFKDEGLSFHTIFNFIFNFVYPVPSNGNGWGASWYLIAMLLGLPIFIFIYKMVKGNLFCLAIISLILEVYYISANGYEYLTHLCNIGTYSFPRVFMYIFLGLIITKNIHKLNTHSLKFYLVIAIILLLLFILENYIIFKVSGLSNSEEVITTAPTSFALTCVGLKWNPKIKNTKTIRKYSTFLYCSQAWPLFILPRIITLSGTIREITFFILIIVLTFIAFRIYEWVQKKTQWKFWSYMV